MEMIYSSDRVFKVWRYSVSHRVLLLRSTRDDYHSTRVDVVFGQVSRMLLKPSYRGLQIARASDQERASIAARIGGVDGDGKLFLIDGSGDNFVVSGAPLWHEDEGSYRDPSFFEPMLLL